MIYQTHKPLPKGISYESPLYQSDVKMWTDLTYPGPDGQPVHDREIGPASVKLSTNPENSW